MSFQLGVVMNRWDRLNFAGDTTLGLLQAAMQRDWSCFIFFPESISWEDKQCMGIARPLQQLDCDQEHIALKPAVKIPLTDLDACLLRVDPPFDKNYYQLTILLEKASKQGLLIANDPRSVRDANEKCFPLSFPDCCPPTLISAHIETIKNFMHQHGKIIIKPLDEGAGRGIYLLDAKDNSHDARLHTATSNGQQWIVAQRYLPEIAQGDKRILLIDGDPVECALARFPKEGSVRANMAAGGHTKIQDLSERDRWICQQIGPTLKEKNLSFVGIDIIGDFLTEINVTSPTGMRHIEKETSHRIADLFLDFLKAQSCSKQ